MKNVFFLFLFFTTYLVFGQNMQEVQVSSGKKNKAKEDSNFIQSYKQYLTIGAFSASPVSEIQLSSYKQFAAKTSDFKANLSNTLGFTIGYRSIYLAVGFKTPTDLSSVAKYGKSSYNSFALRVQNPRYLLSFDYRDIQGYYNTNPISTTDPVTKVKTESYIQRGDIQSQQYVISGIFNLNWKKYSYLASLIHTERQIKSKVGFLLKTSVSYNSLGSDSTLVQNINAKTKVIHDISSLNFMSYKVGPGLGMNLVLFKRIYFSSMLFYSFDVVSFQGFDSSGKQLTSNTSVTGFAEGRAALGYQSKRFYIGMKFIGDQVTFHTTENRISTHFATVTLDIGYRFNAPGFLKKGYDATFQRFLGM
jgi:hypothetical protein